MSLSDRPACESLVLEIWEDVRDLNRRAQRSRSLLAYHRLRVGLEEVSLRGGKFSAVDVPGWAADLKLVQDLLGEVHDLTVLDQMIVKSREPLRGNRFHGVARESGGGTVVAARAVSREDVGENVSAADLARGIAGGEGIAFRRDWRGSANGPPS